MVSTVGSFNELTPVFFCVCPLIDDQLRNNVVKVAVEPHAAGEWFRSKLTGPQNGQMPGINEGKRRYKLAVNKDK